MIMTINLPVSDNSTDRPPPQFDLEPTAHLIRSDEEAIDVARRLAATSVDHAAARDRELRLRLESSISSRAAGFGALRFPRLMAAQTSRL
jgi:hypothetical protein